METRAPIVLATDGTAGCLGAVRMTRALAEHQNREIVAVAVLEPLFIGGAPLPDPSFLVPATFADERASMLRQRVEDQLHEVGLDPDEVEIVTTCGVPAQTIVGIATERGAALIVVGLGRHSAGERWLGSETALRVVQHSHLPVLAVDPAATGLPRRALIAVDFSTFSRDAASHAVELLGDHGEAHLAHVAWSVPGLTDAGAQAAWIETYRVGARTRLEELRRALTSRRALRTFTTLLDGETARALLKYAAMSGSDVIATGSHGYGFLGRLMMGSVSTRLLRQAPCSVLVAPPRGVVVEPLLPEDHGEQARTLEPAAAAG